MGESRRFAWALLLCMLIPAVVLADEAVIEEIVINDELIVLAYHDIVAEDGGDAYATTRSNFVAQMDYLQTHGYNPISLALLNKVYNKQEKLPKKAVLLTFDDGLKSYAEFIVPVLKIYQFPSVLSVVTSWADGNNTPPEYINKLLSWSQLKEINKSPLVSLISHSHDLHHGVTSNPQGNEAAAGYSRMYRPYNGQYETEDEFRFRIRQDLQNSIGRFEKELNQKPLGITWPYGKYGGVIVKEASTLGMKFQLTLDDGPTLISGLPKLNRIMIMNNNVNAFADELNYTHLRKEKLIFAEIHLDKMARQDKEGQERVLSELLDKLESLRVNTVLIHPFSRENKAFFYNVEIDVAADLLNRVSHQIVSRLGVRYVYLQLPANSDSLLSKTVITDLSRLVWFNGVVFDKQKEKTINEVKKIASFYHPEIKFGHFYNAEEKALDIVENSYSKYSFVVVSANQSKQKNNINNTILKAKSIPVKTLVSISSNEKSGADMGQVTKIMKAYGVEHYGISLRQSHSSKNNGLKKDATLLRDQAIEPLAVSGG